MLTKRAGFASYLIEAVCDIGLTWIFYLLLAPVRRDLALLAKNGRDPVEHHEDSAAVTVRSQRQHRERLALSGRERLQVRRILQEHGRDKIKELGTGEHRGGHQSEERRAYLIFRSGFLPKALGVLLALAGIGFVVRNFVLVLAPQYASDLFLLPTFLAALALTVWLLVKGVDVEKFEKWRRVGGVSDFAELP